MTQTAEHSWYTKPGYNENPVLPYSTMSNLSLALPGYFSEQPALIHESSEAPFPNLMEERDAFIPLEAAPPEATYDTDDSGPKYIARINLGLKARVAELIAAESEQEIEKVIIPTPVTRKLGENSLLLAAASL